MKLQLKNLSKEQKKIIALGVGLSILLLWFWVSIYKPRETKLIALKDEMISVENQIAEIIALTQGRELFDTIQAFNKQFNTILKKLPASEEDILDNLSKKAANLKIKVNNIKPLPKILLDTDIPGITIEKLPIILNISCEFKTLGEYLNALQNTLPILIKIEKANIIGKGEGHPGLNIELQISAYLAEKKE